RPVRGRPVGARRCHATVGLLFRGGEPGYQAVAAAPNNPVVVCGGSPGTEDPSHAMRAEPSLTGFTCRPGERKETQSTWHEPHVSPLSWRASSLSSCSPGPCRRRKLLRVSQLPIGSPVSWRPTSRASTSSGWLRLGPTSSSPWQGSALDPMRYVRQLKTCERLPPTTS